MRTLVFILALLCTPVTFATDYRVTILRAVDGDTLEVQIEVWPDVFVKTKVRLAGLNTPESKGLGISKCELTAGLLAKKFTADWVSVHGPIATLSLQGRDKYDRALGSLKWGTADLGAALLAAQLARPYHGEARLPWC